MNEIIIPLNVRYVLTKLQDNGYPSFLVGGCIRDTLLGRKPKDFDICTAATPEQVKSLFTHVADTGIKFGTVTVLGKGFSVEVTTFRKSIKGIDEKGRVLFGFGDNEKDDVACRDFTINGLLFDGAQVIDYVCGQQDITNKVIRSIGQPDRRFQEDPLRTLRAIRLSCQLDFMIEADTLQSINRNVQSVARVAPERVREEFTKILTSEKPVLGLKMLQETGFLYYILPELAACVGFIQHNPRHDKDIFDHTLAVLENTPNNLEVRLAAVLHDIGKPKTFTLDEEGTGHFYAHAEIGADLTRDILNRLRFDKKTVDVVCRLVKEHMAPFNPMGRNGLKRVLSRVGVDNIDSLLKLHMADILGSAPPFNFEGLERYKRETAVLLTQGTPMSIKDLAISGKEIIELGVNQGPQIGKLIEWLLEQVLDDPEKNTRDQLLKMVSEKIKR